MIRFPSEIRTNPNGARCRIGLGSLVLLTTLLVIGCGSDTDKLSTNSPQGSPSSQAKVINKEGNYITADPNPVSAAGLTGKTTVTWGTKGIPARDVHVVIYDASGKEAGLFATGSVGTQEAPWISQPTEFRLYQGTGADRKLLDSVVVTRQ
jgi:hypothetical protein